MRLALVFDKTRDDTVGIYFERACRELGIAYDHVWTKDAASIPSGYQLYLRIDHGDYKDDLPGHLWPKIFYAVDTHLPNSWKRIRHLAKRYDLVCCAHRHAAESLANGAWVPLACDPDVHQAPPRQTRWDVAFVGTEGGVPRKFYLQALRERYPNSFIGHAPHTELGTIYGQARIGFNYSIHNDVNMRIFEILCSGSLLMTNRLLHDDLERLGLRDREPLVMYRHPHDLFALLDYYLCHDDERETIARQGMTQVRQHHTYRQRLRQILQLVSDRIGQPLVTPHKSVEVSPCVS